MSRWWAAPLMLGLACSSPDLGSEQTSPIVVHPTSPRDTAYAEVPLLVIGEEGRPDYEFYSIRQVARLVDGRILVANGGSRELRLYSAEGEFVRSVGARGEGPGEFATIDMVQLVAGDTVLVDDPLLKRLSVFSSSLELINTISYGGVLNSLPRNENQICEEPRIIGAATSGQLVSWAWSCRPWQLDEGLSQISTPIAVVDLKTGGFRTIAELERARIYYADGLQEGQFLAVPFTRANDATFSDDAVWLAAGSDYTIRRLSLSGTIELEIRHEFPRRPVEDSVVQRYRQGYATQLGVPLGRVPSVPIPESLPGFVRVLFGNEQIWASHYASTNDARNFWSVYTQSGESLGIVAFPADFTLRTVAEGQAYGVVTDELDVQRVAVFEVPLERN